MKDCYCNLVDEREKQICRTFYNRMYIRLEKGEYWIDALSDGVISIKINYCPFCGKKLVNK